ncbi:MAG: YihY family inner membrane protein [Candidatus Cloacimonetes bacterium]|nr:YihY family inner membrane protein [Candidatus Cloacimonadota bacterium]MDD2229815.1 YihY family inner membrane protein [Candidatus Cloacimonadota bacterium]
MGKQKNDSSTLHGIFMWLTSYLRIAIIDTYKVYLSLTIPQRRKRILTNASAFMKRFIGRISSERVMRESGSLTYITLLGFVPFITFLVMIAPDLPFLNLGEKFKVVVAKNFIPGSANAIMTFVDDMLVRRMIGFNIFNFIILLVSSYSLFRVIRNTFDRILGMQLNVKQDLLTQVVKFFGTIVFGLVIMIVLFSSSSIPLISMLLRVPLLRWLLVIVPFLMQFFGLVFLYMLLPSVRIKRSSLFRGAFWTTVIWTLAKSFFDIYIYNLTSMQAIYGVMAALPIFLLWIYVNWVIILGGIVMVSVIDTPENGELLRKEPHRVVRVTLEMFSNEKLNGRLEGVLNKKEIKHLVEAIEEDSDT